MNVLRLLFAMLFAFLRPAVAGDDADADAGAQDADAGDGVDAGDQDAGDGDADADAGDADAGAGAGDQDDHAKTKADLAAERAARATVERELAETRLRFQPREQPSEEDRIRSEEDRRLKDEKTGDLEKWQIAANRELRAGRNAAQFALAQAHDVSDKTTFASVCMSDPVAKKYEARVEEALAKERSQGRNATRESIYTYMLGKDMRDGKFKKKAAPSPSSSQDRSGQQTGVNRGKLPGARSDVRAGPGLTNKQRLEKKLDGVQI